MWTPDKIRFFLVYWKDHCEYEMGSERNPSAPPQKQRIRMDGYFVSRSIENADIKKALEKLTPQERYLLWELYVIGGYDCSPPHQTIIRISDEAFEKVKKETGLTGDWINRKTFLALKKMCVIMNPPEAGLKHLR